MFLSEQATVSLAEGEWERVSGGESGEALRGGESTAAMLVWTGDIRAW